LLEARHLQKIGIYHLSMAIAQQQKIFSSPLHEVYQLVADFKNYPQMIEEVQNVTHVESGPQSEVYELDVELMKSVSYQIRVSFEDQKKISWELHKGEAFKVNSGLWTFRKLGESQTLVQYQLEVDFNFFVPKFLVEKTIKAQLPKIFESFENQLKKTV